MLIRAKIQKWGNGLALRVSGAMRDIPNFHAGSEVSVEISEEGLNIKKLNPSQRCVKFPFSEAELLKDMNPTTGHAEALAKLFPSETGE